MQLYQKKGDNSMLQILNQFYERLLIITKQTPLAQMCQRTGNTELGGF